MWCGRRLCSGSDDRIQINRSTAVVVSPQARISSLAEDQESGIVNLLDGLSISPHVPHAEVRCIKGSRALPFQPVREPGLPHRPPIVCKRYGVWKDIVITYRPCNKGVGDSKETSDHRESFAPQQICVLLSSV